MPPFLPRKRLQSPEPEAMPKAKPKPKLKATTTKPTPRKLTLFDELDAGIGSSKVSKSLLQTFASDGSSSSLSSLDDQSEGAPNTKRRKTHGVADEESGDDDVEFEDVPAAQINAASGDEYEEEDFENVVHPTSAIATQPSLGVLSGQDPTENLQLTLRRDTRVSLVNTSGSKKGPSKIERGIRTSTHQLHVQTLMWHNAIRNAWLCDSELQKGLVEALPGGVKKEVAKWRKASGTELKTNGTPVKDKGKGKSVAGSRKSSDQGNVKAVDGKGQRNKQEWSAAKRAEDGANNPKLSDPLLKLLRVLRVYWKTSFRITAPGLRKTGYTSLQRIDEELKSFTNDSHDPEVHGERIATLEEFKRCARIMEGSRDVGAQLFTGLLRGLSIESRMIANLQPLGFAWSQLEEAAEKNPRKLKVKPLTSMAEYIDENEETDIEEPVAKRGKAAAKSTSIKKTNKESKHRSRGSGRKNEPLELSESDDGSAASSSADSDDSVVDITPAKRMPKPSLPYDKDLLFPYYWTEVLSPTTNTYTPVDAVVLHVIAKDAKRLEMFEPRGGKADKAKQVTSYIIGHSSDGTAKDVTTRYLKRHVWPGRTKGNRLPVEKVPIYGRNGKVKRYEHIDWFKSVMRGYTRGRQNLPYTEIDEIEDATDLKPVKVEKKEVVAGKETLQSYKASQQYVLERHFKREEAIKPGAKHVKTFTMKGKGEDSVEEKVYLRKDLVGCKSRETWHKEGRAPIFGEEPLKRVPYRVATTNRRRELAEAEHASGEKPLQGLFSWDQTEWIIPPPIEDGVIPKNNFGNIDLYVDSMLPDGAAHVPYRGTAKICKRLGIDFAEAVTGFEFGHRMAVPVITGVVIAEEHYDAVMEQWHQDEAERVRKEDEKRQKASLNMWGKMLRGMRIIKTVREEYGDEVDDRQDAVNPWTSKKSKDAQNEAMKRIMEEMDEGMTGGFLPEGYNIEENKTRQVGFFPVAQQYENDDEAGYFMVEDHNQPPATELINDKRVLKPEISPNADEHRPNSFESEDERQETAPTMLSLKKRGQPAGSMKNTPAARVQAKSANTLSKTSTKKKQTSAPRGNGNAKRKPRQPLHTEEEEEADVKFQDISDDTNDGLEEEDVPARRARKSRTSSKAQPKATPARKSNRSGGAVSKYFIKDSENDDENEDDQ
ncbi:putative DNA repair protein rhp42 [Calycina marina]|uniref:DNA repair protein rhp42 n=1 Tax=Calycina marina TaxID=1763456 RepID=A0A9P7Z4N9_9HELO|nr:putative DNA repair protein rhp42 [Calycina marina]